MADRSWIKPGIIAYQVPDVYDIELPLTIDDVDCRVFIVSTTEGLAEVSVEPTFYPGDDEKFESNKVCATLINDDTELYPDLLGAVQEAARGMRQDIALRTAEVEALEAFLK